jgi:pimeloyl-ACP methyl ester carboxylesterase
MVTLKRSVFAGLVALLATAAADIVYQRLAESRDDCRFPPPGELIDIGNRRLHVLQSGTGDPVVVIVPALGASAIEWARVQRAVAARSDATVLVVDRGGLGWSDPAPWPRTPATMADELDCLLTALRINQPIILAGHSMGGLAVRLYAARHRERVAHLVLVDSSHEDQAYVLPQFEPAESVRELWVRAARRQSRLLGLYRLRAALGGLPELRDEAEREVPPDLVDAHIARSLTRAWRHAVVQELLGFRLGMRAPRDHARNLGDLPLTVITGGTRVSARWFEGWRQLQKNFLTMSTRSQHLWTLHTGHHINHDDPELLATMFVDIINATK